MDESAWFDSYASLYKILVSSIAGYLILIIYVRIAGKRSTAKMNNFDWIVTVAVGSILASMALLKDVAVTDGAFALALLLGFQYLLTTATANWAWAGRLFVASPSILYSSGQFHEKEMREQRVSESEILSAVRQQGIASLNEVRFVILEPNAEFSIVTLGQEGSPDTVETVPGYEKLVSQQK